eukprot:CAMPEP_0118896488 /NCGR_PEP_ID=MMETSP1166-20130328/4335_1 /TAXON_ID=1104430 /ORGANISM="Chrysoreinhardia sp, Strain CCMP3193" /LENGTH=389 /DNA_ID=CAMNT_0006835547 /DNA_START=95 /DNA_END=1264 /DNA_ORIENTATION=+
MSEPGAEKMLEALRRQPANLTCCNCMAVSKHGHGAVVMSVSGEPLGIFVCHTCKSASQSFSLLCKSVTMSYWKKSEVAKIKAGGNARVRSTWHAKLNDAERPQPGVSLQAAKDFVKACYLDRRWYDASAARAPATTTTTTTTPATTPAAALPPPTSAARRVPRPPSSGSAAKLSPPKPMAKPAPARPAPVAPPPAPQKEIEKTAPPAPPTLDLLSFDDTAPSEEPATPAPDFFDAFAPAAAPPAAAAVPAAAATHPTLDLFAGLDAKPQQTQQNRAQSVPDLTEVPMAQATRGQSSPHLAALTQNTNPGLLSPQQQQQLYFQQQQLQMQQQQQLQWAAMHNQMYANNFYSAPAAYGAPQKAYHQGTAPVDVTSNANSGNAISGMMWGTR